MTAPRVAGRGTCAECGEPGIVVGGFVPNVGAPQRDYLCKNGHAWREASDA